ncbi:MAG: 4'-phosphopantetheinyl transferase superfamily protein [Alteromonadaceae bacterium]|nr:4'-phosphopantetheinyl transferase superfamily protein [Alteromonadaceae bacterium]
MSQSGSHPEQKQLTKLSLQENEIHLWAVQPQIFSSEMGNVNSFTDDFKSAHTSTYKSIDELLTQYKKLLTVDETKKQQRYRFENDRHDALITRAFIRDLLSQYADVQPGDWRFEKGEKDKPEICNPPLPLRFNISHTKNLIICAVMLNDDIGCDVENTTRNNNVLAIADRYFSPSETEELFSLPVEQQRSRFFDYWTLKESYIKAWGLGLAIPLKDFSFNLDNETVSSSTLTSQSLKMKESISLSFAEHRLDQPEIWRSWIFYPSEEHRIAISVRGLTNNQKTDFKFRFFNSKPLVSYTEVDRFQFL